MAYTKPFSQYLFCQLKYGSRNEYRCIGIANIYKRNPPVSMLVVKVESEYFKKATGKTFFTVMMDSYLIMQLKNLLQQERGEL
jgi:hypothetical protein